MAKEDLNTVLEAAKKDLKGKNIIAFIGKTKYGKTVISATLFDTLSNEFLRKYRKKFHVKVLDGHDEIERSHKRIFTKGRFPPPTLPNTKSRIRIEIASKAQLGTKVEYMLRDASGEDIQEIMQKRYGSSKELVKTVLTKYKGSDDPYGPLSYLLFAKIYIILIDSKKFPEWRTEQLRYSQIINSIFDMKDYIDETVDGKIKNPIALTFTKTDELKKKLSSIKTKPIITNEELLENYLPLLQSNLESTHSGKLGIFKFSIEGVNEATEEESREIIREELEELSEMNQELAQKRLENAEKVREDKINGKVKNAMNKARQEATNEGQPPDEIESRASKAGEVERKIAEEENPVEDFMSVSQVEFDSTDKKRYKIDLPVKYSQREYIRFISWLIDNIS